MSSLEAFNPFEKTTTIEQETARKARNPEAVKNLLRATAVLTASMVGTFVYLDRQIESPTCEPKISANSTQNAQTAVSVFEKCGPK